MARDRRDVEEEVRRRRRAEIRRHHPDNGGDPEELIRVLAEFDREARAAAFDEVSFVRRPRGIRGLIARLRRRRPRTRRVQ